MITAEGARNSGACLKWHLNHPNGNIRCRANDGANTAAVEYEAKEEYTTYNFPHIARLNP